MFKVGAKVVYPGHGVGIIEDLQVRNILGSEHKFYMLRILESNMMIMIPVENVATVGLRPVITKEMVSKVYRILRTRKPLGDLTNWNRRYREYSEKIKTGSVIEIAKILRDLLVLKTSKDLSFGERTMLDTARNLLIKEIAIASRRPEEKILADVHAIFSLESTRAVADRSI
jgi:CarD family transcriptional regulator